LGGVFQKSQHGLSFNTLGTGNEYTGTSEGIYIPYALVQSPPFISIYVRLTPNVSIPQHNLIETYVDCPYDNNKRIYGFWVYADGWSPPGGTAVFYRNIGAQFVLADGYSFEDYNLNGMALPLDNKPYTIEVMYDGMNVAFRMATQNQYCEKIDPLPIGEQGQPLMQIINGMGLRLGVLHEGFDYGELLSPVDEIRIYNYGDTKEHFMQIHRMFESKRGGQ
jgi:hypothetical protein